MNKCVPDAVKAVGSTFHLQAKKTSEDYHRLPENFRKPSFYYIGTEDHQKFPAVLQRLAKSPSLFITLSSTLYDNIIHVL